MSDLHDRIIHAAAELHAAAQARGEVLQPSAMLLTLNPLARRDMLIPHCHLTGHKDLTYAGIPVRWDGSMPEGEFSLTPATPEPPSARDALAKALKGLD